MKHDPEAKIFYSDKYRHFSLETITPRVAVSFLDETWLQDILFQCVTWSPNFGIAIFENTLWENQIY